MNFWSFVAGYVSGLLVCLWIAIDSKDKRRRKWSVEQAANASPSLAGGTKFLAAAEEIYNWTFK